MTDWTPPPQVASLLHTNRTGAPSDPSFVVDSACFSGRWRDLIGPAADLLRDEQLHPSWRWVACTALLGWADPVGYDAVLQACTAPTGVIWYGEATDRFTDGDTTFAELAEAIGDSKELAQQRGTAGQRLEALRALLSIAEQVDLVHSSGRGICGALRDDDVSARHAELHAAIERTAARQDGPFNPGVQAAGLLGRLVEVDEPEAVRLARGLLQTHLGRNVVVWLGGVVSNGRGEESLLLADELKQAGRTRGIDPRVDGALGSRQRRMAREAT